MGYLTASGSFARVCGPLLVTFVYNKYGLYVTFGIVEALMVAGLVSPIIFWRELVPLRIPTPGSNNLSVSQSTLVVSMRALPGDDIGRPTTSF